MSSTSILVIYLANHSISQYPKILEQSQKKKVMKIVKMVKTIVKAKKLKTIAKTVYLLALLPFFYHLLYFLKKTAFG